MDLLVESDAVYAGTAVDTGFGVLVKVCNRLENSADTIQ